MPKRILRTDPTPRFNLDNWKDEESLIILYFHYRGYRLKMSTGLKVEPAAWERKTQRAITRGKFSQYASLNLSLDKWRAAVIATYHESNGSLPPAAFRDEIDIKLGFRERPDNSPKIPTLFEFINEYIEGKKSQPRGTWKILLVVFGLLKSFALERKSGALNYDDIDFPFFNDFKLWLFAAPRLHSINYASKVLAVVRQFMRAAQDAKYHSNEAYQDKKFKIAKIKTSKIVMSFDELEALYHLDLSQNERLERVRDLFLIGAYTGLRFSDFTRICPEHIETAAGQSIINITTQKTGTPVSIPLFDIPFQLLRKYNFAAPQISNQKMNDYLKEVAQLAGMNQKVIMSNSKGGKREDTTSEKWELLTTHVARRSFATNFYKIGVPGAVLMKITGHTTERQFMQYIAIEGKQNAVDFAKMVFDKT